MQTYLIEMLQCLVCKGALTWEIEAQRGDRIETGRARCSDCQAVYPVQSGIGIFLSPDLPRQDLWEQAESQLSRHLREHPALEQRLLSTPLNTLAPADRFYRMLVLEERGAYQETCGMEEAVSAGLYTTEYQICHESQVQYLLDALQGSEEPVIDLASGRGHLLQKLASHTRRPLVGTDFSPNVLHRDRRRLEAAGLYDRVSLLAFDAHQIPFKDGAVLTMTTDLGLANIREAGGLLEELRRVVSGRMLAINHFFPEEDAQNRAAIQALGLDAFLYPSSTRRMFAYAGWRMEIANPCRARALPTPESLIFEGAKVDSLPVAETMLDWCTLVAN